MNGAIPDPLGALRLKLAHDIAEGARLLGAEGVFWRRVAQSNPHQVVEFVFAEGERGTPLPDVMEGLAAHIANQILHAATQTDRPQDVAGMLVEAVMLQVGMGLQAKEIGVQEDAAGHQREVTMQGLLRGGR